MYRYTNRNTERNNWNLEMKLGGKIKEISTGDIVVALVEDTALWVLCSVIVIMVMEIEVPTYFYLDMLLTSSY